MQGTIIEVIKGDTGNLDVVYMGGFPKFGSPTIMENQLEKKMENSNGHWAYIGDYRD